CGNVGCCGLRDGCFGSMQWRISPTSGERNRGIGISPMLLYGYNSILIDYDDNRQGLGPLLLLIPLAIRIVPLFMVWYVAPIMMMSLIPHKEIRFIFPSLLALTIVAACGAHRWDDDYHHNRSSGRARLSL
ncbi:hypothetical protein Pmar_PMAR017992, partial [Perkinsus marinus ATCC 50983]